MEKRSKQFETAAEFLNFGRDVCTLVKSTQEMIDRLTGPKCTLGSENVSRSCENSEENKLIRRSEYSLKIAEYMEKLQAYNEALALIILSDDFTNKDKIIVQQRYILNKPWKEIAEVAYITEKTARNNDNKFRNKLQRNPQYWRVISW